VREMETVARVAALAAFVQSGAAEGGAVGAIQAGIDEAMVADLGDYAIIECLVPCVIPALETVAAMNAGTGTSAAALGDAAAQMLDIFGV